MVDAGKRLSGKRILIVEDEWLIADDLTRMLVGEGAHIVGPAASARDALFLIERNGIDAAVLDVHLASDSSVYIVAEVLQRRGIPFMFATGYDGKDIRPDFDCVPHLLKPYEVATVGRMLHAATVVIAR